MRKLIPLYVLSFIALPVNAQSDIASPSSSTIGEVLNPQSTVPDCLGLLKQAKDMQLLGATQVSEKRLGEALTTYTAANQAAQSVAALCAGTEQAEGKVLSSQLASKIGQVNDQRQRVEFCRPAFDKALAHDLKAATGKNQKLPIAELEQLFNVAESAWQEAVNHCRGKDLARAKASLIDTAEAHAAIRETGRAGSECDDAWRGAESMVEMAKAAWAERRWTDSGMLYRKAAMSWEVTEEQCESGERHEQAAKKRESAEVDANNALHCAPRWDAARDISQRLKVEGPALNSQDRSSLSMQAELQWRTLTESCQGPARDKAKSNADVIARERGTPLTLTASKPVTAASKSVLSPEPKSAAPVAATTNTGVSSAIATPITGAVAAVAVSAPIVSAASASSAATLPANALSTTSTTSTEGKGNWVERKMSALAAALPAQATPPEPAATALAPTVIKAGDVTYEGTFKVDGGAQTISGSGTVRWANGNTYTGTLIKSAENGRGRMVWANGQTYEGDWANGKAQGTGEIVFPNGSKYTGAVVDGKPEGSGKVVSTNGDVYEGKFRNGLFEGQGRFRWASGDTYDGEWMGGEPNGRGEYVWTTGARAAGIYKNGVKID